MSNLLTLRDMVVDILKNDANISTITNNVFIQEPLNQRKQAKTYIIVNPPNYVSGIVATQNLELYADAQVIIDIYSWKNENVVKLMDYIVLALRDNAQNLEQQGFVIQEGYDSTFDRFELEGNKMMHYAGISINFYTRVSS